jgi:hypothetical protein
MTKQFLSPAQVVERWDNAIKIGTLANWRSQGHGPPFSKRGAKVVYQLDKLVAWEAANDNTPKTTDENK